tara:strand:- start:909 stop:1601 length:693 start_codon:yes stop_codon:yes gene_type:complete
MKKLSIIIPAFNEEKTILKVLNRIEATKNDKINYEIIIIDDASTDRTIEILKANPNLYDQLIFNEKNLGKGGAVKKGIECAVGDYIIFQDADLEYDPKDIEKFINVFLEFDADVILGSRFSYDRYTKSHNFYNKIGNKLITSTFNILYNTTFMDIYSCYLCFKKNLIISSELKTIGFEQHAEILTKIVSNSKNYYEVPINYNGRSISEGKKIRWYHIFSVIKEIIKGKFR